MTKIRKFKTENYVERLFCDCGTELIYQFDFWGVLDVYTKNAQYKYITTDMTIEGVYDSEYIYGYTGNSQEFIAPVSGIYRVELWGASGVYKSDVHDETVGKGGYVGYLNTNDARDVDRLVFAGDEKGILYYNAFIYQVAKTIGEMSTVLKGKVDRIILG